MEKIISSCIGEKIEKIEGARIDKNEKNIYHTFEQYNKMRKIFAEKNYDIKELTIEQLDEIGRILTINTEREGIKDAIMESELLHLNNEQINLLIELRYKSGIISLIALIDNDCHLVNKLEFLYLNSINRLIDRKSVV